MAETEIFWDFGTAYDFFLSLRVLHEPRTWQLRGAWAAGVRSRLSQENREFLAGSYPFISLPAAWIHDIDPPKSAAIALTALSNVPERDRLSCLMNHCEENEKLNPALTRLRRKVSAAGSWTEDDLAEANELLKKSSYKRKQVQQLIQWWTDLPEFGRLLLSALQEYYEVFYREEEKRIGPVLETALTEAKGRAVGLSAQELVEGLALGLKYESFPFMSEITLAPSFWATPLMVFGQISEDRHLLLFGGRPDDVSLVPGEVVPDSLYRGLKAVADPTRLRILRHLIREPHTPAQLARKLRLRPPTVVHHLHILRIAQMVEITFSTNDQRRYTVREGSVESIFTRMDHFLFNGKGG